MSVVEFFSQAIWHRLSLTLVHFLWQGLAVAVIAYAAVGFLKLKRGNPRYVAYLLAFAVMASCPLITFAVLGAPPRPGAIAPVPMPETESPGPVPHSVSPERPQPLGENTLTVSPTRPAPLREKLDGVLQASLPWALLCWMGGVLILSVRLLLGFIGVRRWRRDIEPLPDGLNARVALLSERLGMAGFSRVFTSHSALEAVALGYLRPMVLLPATMLTGMNPAMIEAVVAHELAHIRRFDLWINLAQRVVETLLFHHPAVWWLSNRLRAERELCCDEMAAAATGERLTYASALESASRARLVARQPALAVGLAHGSRSTLSRVRHVLGLPPMSGDSQFWLAGVIAVAALALAAVPAVSVSTARAKAPPQTDALAEQKEPSAKTLHEAVRKGDIQQVTALIADGADVSARDKQRSTPLLKAAEKGSAVIVELLIAKGADVNAKNRLGFTPLHRAASKGHKDVVQLLLESDAKINVKSLLGHTPLHSAIFRDHPDVARMLIRHGADVNMQAGSDDNATPMDIAVRKGLHDTVELLIESGADIPFPDIHFAAFQGDVSKIKDLIQRGANVDEKDRRGKTPLFFAVCGGQREIVEFLLSNAADVNVKDLDGITPLHHSASCGNLKMTELLLAKGADIDVRDKWGGTPLHGAAEDGQKETASLLIKKGADANAKNKEGRTALHEAVEWGGKEVAALLIAAGADVGAEDGDGYTPLYLATVDVEPDEDIIDLLKSKGATLTATIHLAAETGDFAGVKRYIEEGTDINQGDESGQTPLLLAVFCEREEVVEFLLANGADVNTSRNDGWTPLHMACLMGRKDLAELLIAKGAGVNAKSDDGRTPTDFAKRFNYSEIIELLRKHGATE